MEKVKLPKEVADGVKYFRENYKTGCEYDIGLILREGWEVTIPILAYVESSRENLENYFRALVNGYEVEQTPEDEVREYIKARRKESNSFVEGTQFNLIAKGKYEGAIEVAKILGIEGVNT